jgi:hypothetical protein
MCFQAKKVKLRITLFLEHFNQFGGTIHYFGGARKTF